jgi:hypothetical protein
LTAIREFLPYQSLDRNKLCTFANSLAKIAASDSGDSLTSPENTKGRHAQMSAGNGLIDYPSVQERPA